MTTRTPPAQQPKEHCDHEAVCRHHFQSDYMAGVPCKDKCAYDTRSRPHLAPAPGVIVCPDLMDVNNPLGRKCRVNGWIFCEEIRSGRSHRKCPLQEEAARQAREEVLNTLEEKRMKYETALNASTSCFDEYDRGLIEGKECMVIILREWIESLRGDRT